MKKIKTPIPNAIDANRATVVAITKMSHVNKENNQQTQIDYSNTTEVSNSVYDKISSNAEILALFPDVEISIQILVSSILAPNDLLMPKLNYNMDDNIIPNNVNTIILDHIRTHINKVYKLEDNLSTILRESLFTKGAYVEAIIPNVTIDEVVSKYGKLTTESETKVELTLESAKGGFETTLNITDADLNIEVTNDLRILDYDTNKAILTTESNNISSVSAIKPTFSTFMKKRKIVEDNTISVLTNNNGGIPMRIKLPVGSVLPIHMGSDPSKHMGYLVMLDDNGLPVTNQSSLQVSANGNDIKQQLLDNKASIIKKASDGLKNKTKKDVMLENVDEIYSKALIARLGDIVDKTGLDSRATLPDSSDMYQLAAQRAFKGLKTKLLYVPKDNLTYFAFEYRDNGTGKSLLEKAVLLFSIRASNLFTRIMANVKNAVTTTKVNATLDDKDPDPKATREIIINEFIKSERVKYPIGTMNVTDLVDWMNNVGYRFDIKHPKLPDMDISIEDENRNIAEPDTDLDEKIQEYIIMSFGLKKDMVMAGYDAEFATTVVANNVLFAKTVMERQRVFNSLLSKYVSSVLKNDGVIKEKVCNELRSNITATRRMVIKTLTKDERIAYKDELENNDTLVNYIYSEYESTITVELPKVEVSREEGTLDGLDAFSSMLDTYLPMIISSDTLPTDLVGDISDKMDDVMAAIKTIMIKNWIDNRNFLPEITKFLTLDNTGIPKYDILAEYSLFTDTLSKAIIPYLKKVKKESDKVNDKLDKIENGSDDEPSGNEEPVVEDTPPEDGTTSEDTPPEDGTTSEEDTTTTEDDTTKDDTVITDDSL